MKQKQKRTDEGNDTRPEAEPTDCDTDNLHIVTQLHLLCTLLCTSREIISCLFSKGRVAFVPLNKFYLAL